MDTLDKINYGLCVICSILLGLIDSNDVIGVRSNIMNQDLQNAIEAIRKIQTQADLNTLAEEWKRQMTWIGNQAKRGLKIGDEVGGDRVDMFIVALFVK